MTISTNAFDWQLFEEEDEDIWRDIKDQWDEEKSPEPKKPMLKPVWQHNALLGLIICFAVTSSLWLWYEAQPDEASTLADLSEQIVLENRRSRTPSPHNSEAAGESHRQSSLAGSLQPVHLDKSAHTAFEPQVGVKVIEQIGDRIIVEVIAEGTDGADQLLREYRFYRHTEDGWQTTAPVPAFWGEKETLDTSHIHLQFHERDFSTVIDAASRADRLYQSIRQSLGLNPVSERITFEVVLRWSPEERTWSPSQRNTFRIPSPLLLAKPLDMSDADLLYQMMADALLRRVIMEATASYPVQRPWEGMVGGLTLWQLWKIDGPLTQKSDELLPWMYGPAKMGSDNPPPESYLRSCEYFLSIQRPGIALLSYCVGGLLFDHQPALALQLARLRLQSLDAPESHRESSIYTHSLMWEAASYASFFEFVEHQYGAAQIPKLLRALNEHTSWESLIPAVFDQTVAEFDAQWHAFRLQKYDSSYHYLAKTGN